MALNTSEEFFDDCGGSVDFWCSRPDAVYKARSPCQSVWAIVPGRQLVMAQALGSLWKLQTEFLVLSFSLAQL